VGIAHAEVNNVFAAGARLSLEAVDLFEHIGRQSADAMKFGSHGFPALDFAAAAAAAAAASAGLSFGASGGGGWSRASFSSAAPAAPFVARSASSDRVMSARSSAVV